MYRYYYSRSRLLSRVVPDHSEPQRDPETRLGFVVGARMTRGEGSMFCVPLIDHRHTREAGEENPSLCPRNNTIYTTRGLLLFCFTFRSNPNTTVEIDIVHV
jgi:hypothetical protein